MKRRCVMRNLKGEIVRILTCFQSHSGTSLTPPSDIVHQRIKYTELACKHSSPNLLKLSFTLPTTEGLLFALYWPVDLLWHCCRHWTWRTCILDMVHIMLEFASGRVATFYFIFFTYMAVKENTSSRIWGSLREQKSTTILFVEKSND